MARRPLDNTTKVELTDAELVPALFEVGESLEEALELLANLKGKRLRKSRRILNATSMQVACIGVILQQIMEKAHGRRRRIQSQKSVGTR